MLLIRDPDEVVASYIKSRPKVVAADLGLLQQASLLDELNGAGHPVVVIDSADFLRDPRRYLRGTLRPARAAVRGGDAQLASRTSRVRRGVGRVLVRGGPALHRFRALPTAPDRRPPACCRSRSRRVSPGLRPLVRGALAALGAAGEPDLVGPELVVGLRGVVDRVGDVRGVERGAGGDGPGHRHADGPDTSRFQRGVDRADEIAQAGLLHAQ